MQNGTSKAKNAGQNTDKEKSVFWKVRRGNFLTGLPLFLSVCVGSHRVYRWRGAHQSRRADGGGGAGSGPDTRDHQGPGQCRHTRTPTQQSYSRHDVYCLLSLKEIFLCWTKLWMSCTHLVDLKRDKRESHLIGWVLVHIYKSKSPFFSFFPVSSWWGWTTPKST